MVMATSSKKEEVFLQIIELFKKQYKITQIILENLLQKNEASPYFYKELTDIKNVIFYLEQQTMKVQTN